MDSNEEKVRAVWEWVQVRLAEPFEGVAQGKWVVRIPLLPFSQVGFESESEAWAAGWAFTEARLEEIRQLQEEITALRRNSYAGDEDFYQTIEGCRNMVERVTHHHRMSRILSRLEAILAEKSQGMKETK